MFNFNGDVLQLSKNSVVSDIALNADNGEITASNLKSKKDPAEIENDNQNVATVAYIRQIVPSLANCYTKSESDARYLGINATAKNAEKLQWETSDNHTSTLYEDTNGNLGLKWDNDSKIVLVSRNGNILSVNLYPNAIVFGNTSVGQETGKWEGVIKNIVNNANKTTADSAADSTKDTYVPSYRVLQENYYDKTTSDGRYLAASPNGNQRVVWTTSGNNSALRFQKRADAQSEWTNTISMSIGTNTPSILAVGKIHIGQSTFSGDFVNTIVTSSSSASLSDTAVATPGYVNKFYYDKTTIDSMISGGGVTLVKSTDALSVADDAAATPNYINTYFYSQDEIDSLVSKSGNLLTTVPFSKSGGNNTLHSGGHTYTFITLNCTDSTIRSNMVWGCRMRVTFGMTFETAVTSYSTMQYVRDNLHFTLCRGGVNASDHNTEIGAVAIPVKKDGYQDPTDPDNPNAHVIGLYVVLDAIFTQTLSSYPDRLFIGVDAPESSSTIINCDGATDITWHYVAFRRTL